MMSSLTLRLLVMGLSLLNSSQAFSTGAPSSTCDSMTPGHPGSSQPLPGAPYSLTLSKKRYIPFEVVNVTINAPENEPFEGFMLQARDSSTNALIGSFLPAQGSSIICNQVLTHQSDNPKQSQIFTWRAPVTGSAEVVFRATIVKDYFTYYVGIQSAVLKPRSLAQTTPSPTAEATATVTQTTTTAITSITPRTDTTPSTRASTSTKLSPSTNTLSTASQPETTRYPTSAVTTPTETVPSATATTTAKKSTTTVKPSISTNSSTTNDSKVHLTTLFPISLTLSPSSQTETPSTSSTAISSSSTPSSFSTSHKPRSTPASPSSPLFTSTPILASTERTTSSISPVSQGSTTQNTTGSQDSTPLLPIWTMVTTPSRDVSSQSDREVTQNSTGKRNPLTNNGNIDDDKDDRYLTLYLSLGLVSGWACVLILGCIIRRFRNRARPHRPTVVSFA